MFVYKSRQLMRTVGALILAFFSCAALWLVCRFPFSQNAKSEEYYLYNSSSQAVRKTELYANDLLFLQGVSYEYQTDDGEKFLKEQLQKFRAVVVRKESVGKIDSYYCYSPMLGRTVTIAGEKINLHIAVNGTIVKMGSPIIFGGY